MPVKLVEHVNERVHEYTFHSDATDDHNIQVTIVAVCLLAAAAWALLSNSVSALQLQVAALFIALATVVAVSVWALQITSESVIVLKGVGVLLVSRQRWGGSTSSSNSSRFLDAQDIHSVFVHETLTTTNIHTHLAFMLYSSGSLALAFPHLSPGQELLVPIYKQLQQLHKIGELGQAHR